jgi:hypothetical protein
MDNQRLTQYLLEVSVRDYTVRHSKLYEDYTMTDVIISDGFGRVDLTFDGEINTAEPLDLFEWVCQKTQFHSELDEMLERWYWSKNYVLVNEEYIKYENWKTVYEKCVSGE